MSKKLTIKELVEAGAHYGHIKSKWHPKMKEYIYNTKAGVYIIDLRKSMAKLKEAYEYAVKIGSRGGRILFIGTKPIAREIIQNAAEATNGYFINSRWLGGTLTNFATIRRSVSNLENLQNLAGEELNYEGILKKEASKMEKERQKLVQLVGGIKNMKKMPAAVFIVDPVMEHIAFNEAVTMDIPIVSIVDTNCNPDKIQYLIPGNDDSADTIRIFVSVFVAGLLQGRNQFDKKGSAESTEDNVEAEANTENIEAAPATEENKAEPVHAEENKAEPVHVEAGDDKKPEISADQEQ